MKEKYIGFVIKLFKIITPQYKEDTQIILDVVNIWCEVMNTVNKDAISRISVNYGNKKWKTIAGFRNYLYSRSKENICELSIFCEHEGNRFVYLNTLNNEIIKNEFGMEEFYLSFNSKLLMDIDRFKEIICRVYNVFKLDYAYSFLLEKNIDIISEKKMRNSWFSKSVSIEKHNIARENEMLKIQEGYIPQIYKYNVLNMKQLSKMNNIYENHVVIPINEQLVLYVE